MSDLKTINIKGKDYVPVNERLKYFRENFKGYRLLSELVSNENGVCVFKATVYNENGEPVATGYSQEKENDNRSMVNKTSYIENSETSAWGRALGNFGIGIDSSVASADEVANAIRQQEDSKPKETVRELKKDFESCKILADAEKLWKTLNGSEKEAYRALKEATKLRIRQGDIEKEINKLTAKNYQQNYTNIYQVIDSLKGEEKQKLINLFNSKLEEIGIDEPYESLPFDKE